MSFFLCRLTDPALTEGFSDYSNLIAWGETFPSNYLCVCLGLLGVSLRPTNGEDSPRTALGDTAGPREGQWQPGGNPHGCTRALARPSGQALPDGCCLQLCSCPAACPGEPWRGWIRSPTLHLAQAAWAARAVQAAKQVLGGRGGPWWPRRSSAATFVAPGFSLGNFQHCSFRFSAAGEEAYGCLKGINDA